MDNRDLKAFEAIMQGLAENYNAQLSANGINMRFEALKSFSLDQIKKASLAMVADRKFNYMPNIGEFLDYLGGGRTEDIAELEAAKVWQAISQVGGWKAVVFDNPITQAVIQYTFGGWTKLCEEQTVDNHKWFIKDFARAYGAYSRQNITVYGLLPGRGVGDPALIGDKQKAMQIMEKQPVPVQITAIPEIKRLIMDISET